MPMRHGGSALKNASTWLRRSCLRTTTFLGRVDPVNLEYVLGDIQTDRGNLHVDGSPHVIRLRRSLYGTRCRERAPSATSRAVIPPCCPMGRDGPGADIASIAPRYLASRLCITSPPICSPDRDSESPARLARPDNALADRNKTQTESRAYQAGSRFYHRIADRNNHRRD
jgi:hypothetical protein